MIADPPLNLKQLTPSFVNAEHGSQFGFRAAPDQGGCSANIDPRTQRDDEIVPDSETELDVASAQHQGLRNDEMHIDGPRHRELTQLP